MVLSDPRRRVFVKGVAAAVTLSPALGLADIAVEDTLPLLAPVVITQTDLDSADGLVAFEAWFRWQERNRLVSGLLLDLDRLLPPGSLPAPDSRAANWPLAAYVSNCPHESCKVRLESDPQNLARVSERAQLPDGPLLLCPCHFSIFNPADDGTRISGPAYRGLYRFVLDVQGGSITISRLERSVVDLFG